MVVSAVNQLVNVNAKLPHGFHGGGAVSVDEIKEHSGVIVG